MANPEFSLLRLFDATVFEELDNVEDGLPILAAVLLNSLRQFQPYCFTVHKQDTRNQVRDLCTDVDTP